MVVKHRKRGVYTLTLSESEIQLLFNIGKGRHKQVKDVLYDVLQLALKKFAK